MFCCVCVCVCVCVCYEHTNMHTYTFIRIHQPLNLVELEASLLRGLCGAIRINLGHANNDTILSIVDTVEV